MSAKIYAILTIVVVGLVSFLIGWLLMSSKWKKKFFESDRLRKILENKNAKQADLLVKYKAELKETKQDLFQVQADIGNVEKELNRVRKNNSALKDKSSGFSFSDIEYNKLLNELNLEKRKNATLKADVKRTIAYNRNPTNTVTKHITTKDNLNNHSLNNNTGQVHSVTSTLLKEPLMRNSVAEDSLLFPILQRVSIFSNPGHKDDLTLIDGIDETLAAKLVEVGFYNFKQIAMLTENDLNTISAEMKMDKEQAMKDNWVAQARSLYHKIYSR